MEEKKEHSIRFINSRYQDLFSIPDGGMIKVTFPDRTFVQKCRYIDDYHTRIGSDVYHIFEFAERLERGGGRCEPEEETLLLKAAWEIGGREYLLIEKQESGYSYEVVRKDYSSRTQGFIDRPSWGMNKAREHVLETLALDDRSRYPASFEQIREKMQNVLKASDITQIEWQSSKYYPHVRTAEHTLTCLARGERLHLTYEVSQHDDGESFHIRSDGEDIWDRMPESELRKLEPLLENAVEFGHWKKDVDQADTLSAVRDVRFSIFETENMHLTREQIGKLHQMIDRKEENFLKQQRSPAGKKASGKRSGKNAQDTEKAQQMKAKPARGKRR